MRSLQVSCAHGSSGSNFIRPHRFTSHHGWGFIFLTGKNARQRITVGLAHEPQKKILLHHSLGYPMYLKLLFLHFVIDCQPLSLH